MNLLMMMKGQMPSVKRMFGNMKTDFAFYSIYTLLLLTAIIFSRFLQNDTGIMILIVTLIIGLCLLLCMRPMFDFTSVKTNNNTREGSEYQQRTQTDENLDSRKFIQLVKLSVDISTEVLGRVVESRILSNYENSFSKFLDIEKHYLYHQ